MARQQKKLSKKELKEDPLMKSIDEAQSWLAVNGKKLAIVLGVVLLVVLVSVFMISSKKAANEDSMAALTELQSDPSVLSDEAALVSRLREIADAHKGTTGGSEALFNLAQLALGKDDNEGALELFEEYIHDYSKEFMLTSAAYSGKATALENLERWQEAAETFDLVASRTEASHSRPQSLLNAARCWAKAGNAEKAKVLLEDVIEEYDDSMINRAAKRELARLELEG